MIIFLYPMNECLDVIPKSHKNIKKNSLILQIQQNQ